ncbi:hypothetical protein QJS10_CPB13g01214 [Acorus calamus]|uniref:Uncharacterized protein n=1 Tax=Acorus calamus TaxID=4465 RepID=A0AAV9DJD0_ACOCL|nr:hypothetical protein QJS10_CPB13g01214 [Acorus calamus]
MVKEEVCCLDNSPIRFALAFAKRSLYVALIRVATNLSVQSGMEFFFRSLVDESPAFDNSLANQNIQRCPFLRNINEPTSFSFSAPANFPLPVQGIKGPIFEDGPNFNVAFRLFHGQNGVIPLSERSLPCSKIAKIEPQPQFHPLAAKAATISLSSFGMGGPFSFDSFNDKWKKQNKKKPSKKESSSKGEKSHEALSNEWLETGQCPIAKSYQAVSRILPLVAKALQPPSGVKFKCPPIVVAARAALARTSLVKNLRPQALPAKMLAIGLLGMAANIPLGIWREHTKKFSPSWFVAIHAAVPFIAMLRKSVLMPKTAMAFTIAASILGQTIGSRAERLRLKAANNTSQDSSLKIDLPNEGLVFDPLPVKETEGSEFAKIASLRSGKQCREEMAWEKLSLKGCGGTNHLFRGPDSLTLPSATTSRFKNFNPISFRSFARYAL